MAARPTKINMRTLFDDLMQLCSVDDMFYYKDIRFHGINYRIFNYYLCSYSYFQLRPVALNCRGTMFNINNPKQVRLVSLPMEKFFNYQEGFGRQKYHERGRFGDKMEKMDGTLISTFLHGTTVQDQSLRLRSKQSLSSKQVLDAARLLEDDFKNELDRLSRMNLTVNMEYVSPSNHVFVSYSEPKLVVLSIRSHDDGRSWFGTQLHAFLVEHQFPVTIQHLVPFESVPAEMTHDQLLRRIYEQPRGEGYVVEIIQPDQTSYLVKIKTHKYLSVHRDGEDPNSSRSLLEAILTENADDLKALYHKDHETLKRIEEMETRIIPRYNQMLRLVENFYQTNKALTRKKYIQLLNSSTETQIYAPLIIRLYDGEKNDYRSFALKHAKELFDIKLQDTSMMSADESQEQYSSV